MIWDVGHQAYPHKVLTGRRDRIRTLRQKNGLSGFTRRAESPYDPFGAGHSSTSISAGLGMAVASRAEGRESPRRRGHRRWRHVGRHGLRGDEQCRRHGCPADRHPQRQRHVDRAAHRRHVGLSGAPRLRPRLSRHPQCRQAARQGAAAASSRTRRAAPRNSPAAGGPVERCSRNSASTMSARSMATTSTICCRCCRTSATPRNGPILVHVVTKKGKGYEPAETSRRQISRRQQVQCHHRAPRPRRRPTPRPTPPSLPKA